MSMIFRLGRLRLLAVSPSLLGERQLSQTTGSSMAGLVMPRAALATSTMVAGRELLVPGGVELVLIQSTIVVICIISSC